MKQLHEVLLVGLLLVSGCTWEQPNIPEPNDTGKPATRSAREILQSMVQTYRDAKSYRDQGIVTLSYRYANEARKDVSQVAVSWARTGEVRLQAYQLSLAVGDGKIKALITDAATGNMGNQVLVRPAGKTISLEDLYADPMVQDLLLGGRGGQPLQLELLMQENPFQGFLAEDVSRELLGVSDVEGHPCDRVAVDTAGGRYELWIDQRNSLLRRLAYPATTFAGDMLADPQVKNVQLVADLRGAELNPGLKPGDLALDVPDQAREVERFVVPPQPLPTDLYGKRVGSFEFIDTEGNSISREGLAGKITVLMWFVNHQANRDTVVQLNQVVQQFADDPAVAIYAVCTESVKQIQDLKKEWKINLPIVQDLEAYGRDIFRIPVAPTMVVLDPRGRVQLFEPGPNSELGPRLVTALKELAAGTDLAARTLTQFAEEEQAYQQRLDQSHQAAVTSTQVKPATAPELFELEAFWTNDDFEQPLNPLLVKETEDTWCLFVLDGKFLVKLDLQGRVVKRYDLKLDSQAPVTYLRTAVDAAGKRWFAAGQTGGSRVYVFDANWNQQFAFPAAGQRHPGIDDFQLVDLDGDGTVELYLGYRGQVGLQRIALTGEREWSYRGVERVLSLAPWRANPDQDGALFLTTEAGQLHRLTASGRDVQQVGLQGLVLHHLFPASLPVPSGAEFCAIASTQDRLAIGLDKELKQVWQYELPAGTFSVDLRFVQSANLLAEPGSQWLIAAADGTLHMISADGEFADAFATGDQIRGFTVARFQGQVVLVIAGEQGVRAWKVRQRDPVP